MKKTDPAGVEFVAGPFPHVHDSDSVSKMMWTVTGSLLPLSLAACWINGFQAVWILCSSIASAVLTEFIFNRARGVPPTLRDGSACVTGLLLALSLPVRSAWWMPPLGSIAAVGLAKEAFGGLGANPVNPALFGRLLLQLVHPAAFWPRIPAVDGLTQATPLLRYRAARDILVNASAHPAERVAEASVSVSEICGSAFDGFIARHSACLGETSMLLLLFAIGFLLYRRVIGWKIPLAAVVSSSVLFWVVGGTEGAFSGNLFFNVSAGGLVLASFLMATDPVTSPVRAKDRLIFGAGCGILTVIFRLWGPHPEGVGYAIVMMNLIHHVRRRRWLKTPEKRLFRPNRSLQGNDEKAT
jgi:Na+-translocating ferredoxin:NAD+ oxidoreductase subunit D